MDPWMAKHVYGFAISGKRLVIPVTNRDLVQILEPEGRDGEQSHVRWSPHHGRTVSLPFGCAPDLAYAEENAKAVWIACRGLPLVVRMDVATGGTDPVFVRARVATGGTRLVGSMRSTPGGAGLLVMLLDGGGLAYIDISQRIARPYFQHRKLNSMSLYDVQFLRGGRLLATALDADKVLLVSPTGRILDSVSFPRPYRIVQTAQMAWVVSSQSASYALTVHVTGTGLQASRIPLGPKPLYQNDVAAIGAGVLMSTREDGRLLFIDPDKRRVVASQTIAGSRLTRFAQVTRPSGSGLFVMDAAYGRVYEVRVRVTERPRKS